MIFYVVIQDGDDYYLNKRKINKKELEHLSHAIIVPIEILSENIKKMIIGDKNNK